MEANPYGLSKQMITREIKEGIKKKYLEINENAN